MKRYYLTEAGINRRPDNNWGDKKHDKREPKWKEERSKYGFDERETWNLNDTFFMWLYERLKMYKEINICDLTYHKFDYEGQTYDQGQMIDKMLEDIEFYFNVDGKYFDEDNGTSDEYIKYDQDKFDKEMEIGKLWAMVLPAMWW